MSVSSGLAFASVAPVDLSVDVGGLRLRNPVMPASGTFAEQWWAWLRSALTGDLGQSLTLRQPVTEVIAERAGWSLLLCGLAFLISLTLGTTLGVLAARRPGSAEDHPRRLGRHRR